MPDLPTQYVSSGVSAHATHRSCACWLHSEVRDLAAHGSVTRSDFCPSNCGCHMGTQKTAFPAAPGGDEFGTYGTLFLSRSGQLVEGLLFYTI